MLSRRTAAILLALTALAACGKKGPPLPPLHIVPDAVGEPTLRRVDDEVRLRFVLPSKNANGPNPVNLDRVEIYAATVAAGAAAPPNREFLTAKFRIATIPVRPPADENTPQPTQPPAKPDERPGPGEVAIFTETLDEAKLKPVFTTVPPAPPAAPVATPTPADKAAVPAAPPTATRIYAVRGIARNGRPGSPSTRMTLPLVDAPPAPTNVQVRFTASDISVTWLPPVAEADPTAKPPVFNVYAAASPSALNTTPLTSASFTRAGVEFGREECFVVRSVARTGVVSIESSASAPVCVTPADTFAPSAPGGLSAVSADGVVNLIWDASPEADVAGYIVLRAEAPGDTLSAITAEPIQTTTYRDTAVKAGVRYVYAVVAVDKATPRNTSPLSRRVEETVR